MLISAHFPALNVCQPQTFKNGTLLKLQNHFRLLRFICSQSSKVTAPAAGLDMLEKMESADSILQPNCQCGFEYLGVTGSDCRGSYGTACSEVVLLQPLELCFFSAKQCFTD